MPGGHGRRPRAVARGAADAEFWSDFAKTTRRAAGASRAMFADELWGHAEAAATVVNAAGDGRPAAAARSFDAHFAVFEARNRPRPTDILDRLAGVDRERSPSPFASAPTQPAEALARLFGENRATTAPHPGSAAAGRSLPRLASPKGPPALPPVLDSPTATASLSYSPAASPRSYHASVLTGGGGGGAALDAGGGAVVARRQHATPSSSSSPRDDVLLERQLRRRLKNVITYEPRGVDEYAIADPRPRGGAARAAAAASDGLTAGFGFAPPAAVLRAQREASRSPHASPVSPLTPAPCEDAAAAAAAATPPEASEPEGCKEMSAEETPRRATFAAELEGPAPAEPPPPPAAAPPPRAVPAGALRYIRHRAKQIKAEAAARGGGGVLMFDPPDVTPPRRAAAAAAAGADLTSSAPPKGPAVPVPAEAPHTPAPCAYGPYSSMAAEFVGDSKARQRYLKRLLCAVRGEPLETADEAEEATAEEAQMLHNLMLLPEGAAPTATAAAAEDPAAATFIQTASRDWVEDTSAARPGYVPPAGVGAFFASLEHRAKLRPPGTPGGDRGAVVHLKHLQQGELQRLTAGATPGLSPVHAPWTPKDAPGGTPLSPFVLHRDAAAKHTGKTAAMSPQYQQRMNLQLPQRRRGGGRPASAGAGHVPLRMPGGDLQFQPEQDKTDQADARTRMYRRSANVPHGAPLPAPAPRPGSAPATRGFTVFNWGALPEAASAPTPSDASAQVSDAAVEGEPPAAPAAPAAGPGLQPWTPPAGEGVVPLPRVVEEEAEGVRPASATLPPSEEQEQEQAPRSPSVGTAKGSAEAVEEEEEEEKVEEPAATLCTSSSSAIEAPPPTPPPPPAIPAALPATPAGPPIDAPPPPATPATPEVAPVPPMDVGGHVDVLTEAAGTAGSVEEPAAGATPGMVATPPSEAGPVRAMTELELPQGEAPLPAVEGATLGQAAGADADTETVIEEDDPPPAGAAASADDDAADATPTFVSPMVVPASPPPAEGLEASPRSAAGGVGGDAFLSDDYAFPASPDHSASSNESDTDRVAAPAAAAPAAAAGICVLAVAADAVRGAAPQPQDDPAGKAASPARRGSRKRAASLRSPVTPQKVQPVPVPVPVKKPAGRARSRSTLERPAPKLTPPTVPAAGDGGPAIAELSLEKKDGALSPAARRRVRAASVRAASLPKAVAALRSPLAKPLAETPPSTRRRTAADTVLEVGGALGEWDTTPRTRPARTPPTRPATAPRRARARSHGPSSTPPLRGGRGETSHGALFLSSPYSSPLEKSVVMDEMKARVMRQYDELAMYSGDAGGASPLGQQPPPDARFFEVFGDGDVDGFSEYVRRPWVSAGVCAALTAAAAVVLAKGEGYYARARRGTAKGSKEGRKDSKHMWGFVKRKLRARSKLRLVSKLLAKAPGSGAEDKDGREGGVGAKAAKDEPRGLRKAVLVGGPQPVLPLARPGNEQLRANRGQMTAVVIGIGVYRDVRLIPCQQAVGDAIALAAILRAAGYRVYEIHDEAELKPSAATILATVRRARLECPLPQDVCLVTFVGLGHQSRSLVAPLAGYSSAPPPPGSYDATAELYLFGNDYDVSGPTVSQLPGTAPKGAVPISALTAAVDGATPERPFPAPVLFCDTVSCYAHLRKAAHAPHEGMVYVGGRQSIGGSLTARCGKRYGFLATLYLKKALIGHATRDSRVTTNTLNVYIERKLKARGYGHVTTTASNLNGSDLVLIERHEIAFDKKDVKVRSEIAKRTPAKIFLGCFVSKTRGNPRAPAYGSQLLKAVQGLPHKRSHTPAVASTAAAALQEEYRSKGPRHPLRLSHVYPHNACIVLTAADPEATVLLKELSYNRLRPVTTALEESCGRPVEIAYFLHKGNVLAQAYSKNMDRADIDKKFLLQPQEEPKEEYKYSSKPPPAEEDPEPTPEPVASPSGRRRRGGSVLVAGSSKEAVAPAPRRRKSEAPPKFALLSEEDPVAALERSVKARQEAEEARVLEKKVLQALGGEAQSPKGRGRQRSVSMISPQRPGSPEVSPADGDAAAPVQINKAAIPGYGTKDVSEYVDVTFIGSAWHFDKLDRAVRSGELGALVTPVSVRMLALDEVAVQLEVMATVIQKEVRGWLTRAHMKDRLALAGQEWFARQKFQKRALEFLSGLLEDSKEGAVGTLLATEEDLRIEFEVWEWEEYIQMCKSGLRSLSRVADHEMECLCEEEEAGHFLLGEHAARLRLLGEYDDCRRFFQRSLLLYRDFVYGCFKLGIDSRSEYTPVLWQAGGWLDRNFRPHLEWFYGQRDAAAEREEERALSRLESMRLTPSSDTL
eukprot:TRINITY_DN3698_c1_g2_i1.p1 TRINITY_DN3698_c1_g2~~TRINITY_DN3698_c1_g2_i1.p1  ORF type:complete len:2312 (+),score=760.15 TRINITY_DN3698_c1_g2_i1:96-7031(+)